MKSQIKIYIASFSIFIFFTIFMLSFFKNYIIKQNNEEQHNNIINTEKYIKQSIDFIIQKKKDDYIKLSNLIFSNKKVLLSLENKNRSDFYKYTKEYYTRAKKRDDNLWGLHIVLPNNLSFIRVHKSYAADNPIKKGKKPSIDKVNEIQEIVTSFEAGKFGYFLRINTPIFSKENKYLGVSEFSINIDSLIYYIKDNFEYESIFLIKNSQNKNFLIKLPKTNNGLVIFKSTNHKMFKDIDFEKILHHVKEDPLDSFIQFKSKNYNSVLTNLSDTATLITAFDVTSLTNGKEDFEKNINFLFYFITCLVFLLWIIATRLYVTSKKQINHKLKQFDTIISTHVNYTNTNLDGIITEASYEFCRISGYKRKKLIGKSHNIVRHNNTSNDTYYDLWETILQNKTWKGELQNISKDGKEYWFFSTISPLYDENNIKIGYTSVSANITDKKKIEQLSITDGLTGLYNRRYFDTISNKILNQVKRDGKYLTFLILDIDNFKLYNDIYGHVQGDLVIKEVANSIKEIFRRDNDYIFRIGGEEFAVLSSSIKKESLLLSEQLTQYIQNLNILHERNQDFNCITVSLGLISIKANDNLTVEKLYQAADEQLYKSKDNGRNQVHSVYSV